MANKIKGITIEINGDVTNLKKALEGVESSAKKTTQELKQINQQLKYDPSNTTLIAQKHELLGKQVKDTKEKLETLKVAQQQFDQEALKTEEGAEQYRALQREIEKTEGQLKNLKKEYSETNSATVALNNVGDKLQDVGGKMTSVHRCGRPEAAGVRQQGLRSRRAADAESHRPDRGRCDGCRIGVQGR